MCRSPSSIGTLLIYQTAAELAIFSFSMFYFQLCDLLIVHVSDNQIFVFSTYPGLINSFSINKFVVRR